MIYGRRLEHIRQMQWEVCMILVRGSKEASKGVVQAPSQWVSTMLSYSPLSSI